MGHVCSPVVAIDGPSGSGKSSVSRAVATARGLAYLDTGAMYRAVTAAVLAGGLNPDDATAVATCVGGLVLESGTDPQAPWIRLNGSDVGEVIRGAEVTGAVSSVSRVPAVRQQLVKLQQLAVAVAADNGRGIVVEGRDIGTVVLPDADLKVFLVADPAVRARRRALEDAARGRATETDAAVESALARRDHADSSRAVSPLRPADDAVVVDASDKTLEQVVAQILRLLAERAPVDAP